MAEKQRLRGIAIDFSMFQDMDDLISVELNAGDHITIKGWKSKGSMVVTYELFRENAIAAGLLREEC